MLDINKETNGNKLVVALTGRLDTSTAPQLEEELKGATDNITDLLFDMKGLEYISSAGLRVLLATQKAMNAKGSMKITGANENIMEIFEVTGFVDILSFE